MAGSVAGDSLPVEGKLAAAAGAGPHCRGIAPHRWRGEAGAAAVADVERAVRKAPGGGGGSLPSHQA